MKVLFVCNGNVARSQIAETVFNHLSVHHQATSAGTAVRCLDVEGQTLKDRAEDPQASCTPKFVLELMKEQGFDLSNNVRNQVTPEIVDAAERLILMLGSIPPEDFLAHSDKLEVWDITDPVHTPRESTAIIMQEVTQKVQELVRELG